MIVKFKKLHPNATLPIYSTEHAACMDLTSVDYDYTNYNSDIINYKIGLSVEIPTGFVGLLFPRSSIRKTDLVLSNSVGVIDSDFRGEIIASFRYVSNEEIDSTRYEIGERCCQLMIIPIPKIEPIFIDELSNTERGSGGFGSTGT